MSNCHRAYGHTPGDNLTNVTWNFGLMALCLVCHFFPLLRSLARVNAACNVTLCQSHAGLASDIPAAIVLSCVGVSACTLQSGEH